MLFGLHPSVPWNVPFVEMKTIKVELLGLDLRASPRCGILWDLGRSSSTAPIDKKCPFCPVKLILDQNISLSTIQGSFYFFLHVETSLVLSLFSLLSWSFLHPRLPPVSIISLNLSSLRSLITFILSLSQKALYIIQPPTIPIPFPWIVYSLLIFLETTYHHLTHI